MSSKPMQPRSGLPTAGGFALSVSRRQFLRGAAGAGIALGSALALPRRASAQVCVDDLPSPIAFSQKLPPPTKAFGPFHFMLPGPVDQGIEPSVIGDFNGFLGVANTSGKATDGSGNTFSNDIRFMKGVYVGVDGEVHRGAFAFL